VRIAIVLVALAATLAVSVGFLVTRGGNEPDFRGSQPPAALTLPIFNLQDDQGRTVRSMELHGKALAVTFLDAQCQDACPIIAAQVAQTVRLLGGDRGEVEALAFSVDPIGDTPKRVQTFLRRYRATGKIRYLNGTVAELLPLWRAFAVAASYYTGKSNLHSAPVRVYDRQGRWRSTLHPGVDLTAANLANDLREALKSS
jgi:protein SCO1